MTELKNSKLLGGGDMVPRWSGREG